MKPSNETSYYEFFRNRYLLKAYQDIKISSFEIPNPHDRKINQSVLYIIFNNYILVGFFLGNQQKF